MSKKDQQQVTLALMALTDVREALTVGNAGEALSAIADAEEALADVQHTPGVPVARAAERLGLSRKTIEAWIQRGALRPIPGVSPTQVDIESLRRVSRAVAELRDRGRDRDWLQALADYLHDREASNRPAVREGLEQLRRGEVHPA